MNRISICAAALCALMGVSSAIPTQAMPLPAPTISRSTDVQQVAKVVVKYGYYRGHRGYRYARRGYRRHVDGYWYPSVVFAPVVVIKPARAWRWCGPRYNRYRCWR
ncbi:BA14K family protein [Rhizobium sp. KVB221]|uniref:BA14K family protein n=1 Tax=Rhizobium setariae TaxID=2801340 RepID=A0A936YRA3_9HYPH|nr:BA14K family protein [Rhizobium setariae]MBL0371341.1 BA14K family protein [Rhizobium setariae]